MRQLLKRTKNKDLEEVLENQIGDNPLTGLIRFILMIFSVQVSR